MSGSDSQKGMRCIGSFKRIECPCGATREFPNKKAMDLFMKLHAKKCDRMNVNSRDIGYVSRNIRLNRTINEYMLGKGLIESNPRK
jgi:hypothetical protein